MPQNVSGAKKKPLRFVDGKAGVSGGGIIYSL